MRHTIMSYAKPLVQPGSGQRVVPPAASLSCLDVRGWASAESRLGGAQPAAGGGRSTGGTPSVALHQHSKPQAPVRSGGAPPPAARHRRCLQALPLLDEALLAGAAPWLPPPGPEGGEDAAPVLALLRPPPHPAAPEGGGSLTPDSLQQLLAATDPEPPLRARMPGSERLAVTVELTVSGAHRSSLPPGCGHTACAAPPQPSLAGKRLRITVIAHKLTSDSRLSAFSIGIEPLLVVCYDVSGVLFGVATPPSPPVFLLPPFTRFPLRRPSLRPRPSRRILHVLTPARLSSGGRVPSCIVITQGRMPCRGALCRVLSRHFVRCHVMFRRSVVEICETCSARSPTTTGRPGPAGHPRIKRPQHPAAVITALEVCVYSALLPPQTWPVDCVIHNIAAAPPPPPPPLPRVPNTLSVGVSQSGHSQRHVARSPFVFSAPRACRISAAAPRTKVKAACA